MTRQILRIRCNGHMYELDLEWTGLLVIDVRQGAPRFAVEPLESVLKVHEWEWTIHTPTPTLPWLK